MLVFLFLSLFFVLTFVIVFQDLLQMIAYDSFGHIIQPSVYSYPQAASTIATTSNPHEASQPPSIHTSTIVVNGHNCSQDTAL